MPANSTNNDSENANALRSMMLRVAAWNTKALDGRTAASLRASGLLKKAEPNPLPSDTAELLATHDHPKRVNTPPGPLLFIQTGELTRATIDAVDSLLSTDRNIRGAALSYLCCLGSEREMIGGKAASTLAEYGEAIKSDDSDAWRTAAIKASDALQSDFLLNTAGLRQCIALEFGQGVDQYFPALLRPSADSVNGLNVSFTDPVRQQDAIKKQLVELTTRSTPITEAFGEYFQLLGHLPLAVSCSLGGVVSTMASKGADPSILWKTLWEWADQMATPVARFHVCQAFCANVSLVPRDQIQFLWNEIFYVMRADDGDASPSPWAEPWQLRCDLARYYCHYLECLVPGWSGDQTASVAWWLSERVASSFGTNQAFLRQIRETTVRQGEGLASFVWHLIHPPGQPSRLRFGTTLVRSIWSVTLECQLGSLIRISRPLANQKEIEATLMASSLSMFPWQSIPTTDAVYGFDESPMHTLAAWTESNESAESRDVLTAVLEARNKLHGVGDLAEQLSKSAGGIEGEEFLVAGAFRAWAYSHEGDFEIIWEKLVDNDWRNRVFGLTRSKPLELIFEALNEMRSRSPEKWHAQLPHAFAVRAIETPDPDRKAAMFAFAIICSISAATTGAIYRLLRPETRHDFTKLAEEWRERLLSVQQGIPTWVAARLRPAIIALRGTVS